MGKAGADGARIGAATAVDTREPRGRPLRKDGFLKGLKNPTVVRDRTAWTCFRSGQWGFGRRSRKRRRKRLSRTPRAEEQDVIPQPPDRPAIPVGKLKEVLAQVPDDHFLVPSQVYDFFIVDKDGHNKGYISASGELHWWPVEEK